MRRILSVICGCWFLVSGVSGAAEGGRERTKKPTSIGPEPEKLESLWKIVPPKLTSKTAFATTKLDFLPEVVAQWGQHSITGAQIKELLLPVVARGASSGRLLSVAELQTMAYQTATTLVDQELLKAKCVKDGFAPDKAAVAARMVEMEKQSSPEKVAAFLAQTGETRDDYSARVADEMMVNRWIQERIIPGIEVDDAALEKCYNDNKARFKGAESARVAHILIKAEPGAGAEVQKKARAESTKLLEELKNGADFAKLAEANSACPSRTRGGDLGFFTKGQMPPAFEEVAFKLKKDELSGVVATDFGFHIIKGIDHRNEGVLPLADVRDKVKVLATQQQAVDVVRRQINYMRQEEGVQFFLRPPPAPVK